MRAIHNVAIATTFPDKTPQQNEIDFTFIIEKPIDAFFKSISPAI